ncbi:cytochrome c biogenesis CcdA family protein [Arcanobacterium hippocoleae]|uniref:cytochrome c biogenesis CcdA family protein n=1 Tax=Arcanobacterium hippocoleae TaxID=149017 RepID=UPI00333EC344
MLSVVLAFAAGFITFVSPCFLPIVPVFIGQLMGERTQQLSRKGACLNAVCFMLGFSIVFIAIWISIGLIGLVAGRYVEIFRIIGGVVLVLIGLHVARLIRIPLLDKYYRGDLKTPAAIRNGVLRSGLMGVVFGAGWTPCIGPILGGILAFASQSETAFAGAFLMLAYCIGLGVPIVLVAIGAVDVRARFGFFKNIMH